MSSARVQGIARRYFDLTVASAFGSKSASIWADLCALLLLLLLVQAVAALPDSWDPSQRHALQQALTQRVSLIQGPPGTGKTFTGVELCNIILSCSSACILVVCYTNHALDQFLEALLDKGMTSMVRIGGRSKSQRLEPYNIRQLTSGPRGQGQQGASRGYMTPADLRQLHLVRQQIDGVEQEVAQLSRELTFLNDAGCSSGRSGGGSAGSSWGRGKGVGSSSNNNAAGSSLAWHKQQEQLAKQKQQQQQSRLGYDVEDEDLSSSTAQDPWKVLESPETYSSWEWEGLGTYLEDELGEVWEQLRVPQGCRVPASYLCHRWVQGKRDRHKVDEFLQQQQQQQQQQQGNMEEGSWREVKGRGRGSGAGSWSKAEMGAASKGDPLKDVWAMPFQQRQSYLEGWRQELRVLLSEQLQEQLMRMHKLQEQLRSLRNSGCEAVIGQSRIVGCTTTGAALYKDLLLGPNAPTVVLVEEAAEILEAHVMTSLSPRTQHLVMIGDHKQLRPKVECYELSVQAGRGHTLNVSLFERLVLGGFPHATLAVQHRMHPEISALIKHTYPSLQDHSKVKDHPELRWLEKRVVFIDHSEPELEEKEKGVWRKGAAEHQSKVNEHEAAMVAQIITYLLQQGYGSEQLVVLTPYLGQLLELQKEMSKELKVIWEQ
jgi:hypothetical protein